MASMSMDPIASLGDPVTLEKLQLAARTHLSPAVAESVELSVQRDMLTGNLVGQIRAAVQAQKIAEGTVTDSHEVVVETPETTWQMFKHRHAASWWLRWLVQRRPVRMTEHRRTVTLTATWKGYATFPDSSLVIRDDRLGAPVYFLQRDHWTKDWRDRDPSQLGPT